MAVAEMEEEVRTSYKDLAGSYKEQTRMKEF